MMARYPDMVHLEKAIDNPIKDTPLYSVDPTYEHDTLCYVPSTLEHAKAAAKKSGGCTVNLLNPTLAADRSITTI